MPTSLSKCHSARWICREQFFFYFCWIVAEKLLTSQEHNLPWSPFASKWREYSWRKTRKGGGGGQSQFLLFMSFSLLFMVIFNPLVSSGKRKKRQNCLTRHCLKKKYPLLSVNSINLNFLSYLTRADFFVVLLFLGMAREAALKTILPELGEPGVPGVLVQTQL